MANLELLAVPNFPCPVSSSPPRQLPSPSMF